MAAAALVKSDMRLIALAALLLSWVFANHYGIDYVARAYPDPDAARRALFYIAQGINGVVWAMAVGLLAPRKVWATPLLLVCLWSIYENTLVASCRLGKSIGGAVPQVPFWEGLCGGYWYAAGLAFGLVAATAVGYGASRGR